MPEMEMERSGADYPIAILPPGGPGDRVVEIYVQVAKAEAGCSICGRVTPKGASRITLKIKMPDGINDLGEPQPPKRLTQRYHFHPACFTKPMGSEVRRGSFDCWDCGSRPPLNANQRPDWSLMSAAGWRHAFTTTRFAAAPLCQNCCAKAKWRKCDNCDVMFPQWMIVTGEYENRRRRSSSSIYNFEVDDQPMVDHGDWCSYCAERYGVTTRQKTQQTAEEFEELRRQIVEKGVFE